MSFLWVSPASSGSYCADSACSGGTQQHGLQLGDTQHRNVTLKKQNSLREEWVVCSCTYIRMYIAGTYTYMYTIVCAWVCCVCCVCVCAHACVKLHVRMYHIRMSVHDSVCTYVCACIFMKLYQTNGSSSSIMQDVSATYVGPRQLIKLGNFCHMTQVWKLHHRSVAVRMCQCVYCSQVRYTRMCVPTCTVMILLRTYVCTMTSTDRGNL